MVKTPQTGGEPLGWRPAPAVAGARGPGRVIAALGASPFISNKGADDTSCKISVFSVPAFRLSIFSAQRQASA